MDPVARTGASFTGLIVMTLVAVFPSLFPESVAVTPMYRVARVPATVGSSLVVL